MRARDGKRGGMRRIWKAAGWMAATLVVAPLGYGAAGLVGGAIPRNAGWTEPAAGVRVLIESNGVHTGLILPKRAAGADLSDLVPARDLTDPRYARFDHIAVGWGERTFYLETPTWADVRPWTVLRAALGSDRTVVHVEHVAVPAAGDDTRAVRLRPAEYRRLAAFVRASFAAPFTPVARGYGAADAFYAGTGRYDAVHDCNAWTGDALSAAGVRVGAWTPFPVTVLGWFAA